MFDFEQNLMLIPPNLIRLYLKNARCCHVKEMIQHLLIKTAFNMSSNESKQMLHSSSHPTK